MIVFVRWIAIDNKLARALQLNLATYLVGKAIQGVTAAYLTRIAGKSFIEYFRHDQDWGDGGMTEVVQQQFQLSRKDEFIKAFVQAAITKVVQPLTNQTFINVPALDENQSSPTIPAPSVDDWEEKPRHQDW